MKTVLVVFALWIFFLPFASPAADVVKIGVIDFQKILELSNAGKSAQEEINKRGKEMEADLKNKGAAIEAMQMKIERESLRLSKEAMEDKLRELRIKIGDYKALQKTYMEDFRILEKQSVSRIQKEVNELVQGIGNKEGFMMIVEKRSGGVVYTPTTIDITNAVIQAYNSRVSVSEPKQNFDRVSNGDLGRFAIRY